MKSGYFSMEEPLTPVSFQGVTTDNVKNGHHAMRMQKVQLTSFNTESHEKNTFIRNLTNIVYKIEIIALTFQANFFTLSKRIG